MPAPSIVPDNTNAAVMIGKIVNVPDHQLPNAPYAYTDAVNRRAVI
jgi:hypothetical protein